MVKRCDFKKCKRPCGLLSIKCEYCENLFCSGHRLTEDHKCKNILDQKKEKREINSKKLEAEKCIPKKIIQI